MDRPNSQTRPDRRPSTVRALAIAAGVVLATIATACRSTKSEIPPARPMAPQQGVLPQVGFSAEPHMPNGAATANLSNSGASMAGFGPTAAGGRSGGGAGAGAPGSFGPPGTSGTMDSPATSPAGYSGPAGP